MITGQAFRILPSDASGSMQPWAQRVADCPENVRFTDNVTPRVPIRRPLIAAFQQRCITYLVFLTMGRLHPCPTHVTGESFRCWRGPT